MATLKQVTVELLKDLEKFNKLPRFLQANLYAKTKDRIFTDGIKADSSKIGEYALKTEEYKKKKGRFTSSTINLRDTNTLARSYTYDFTNKSVEFGFSAATRNYGVTNEELVGYLEEKYGDIFGLTKEEEDLIDTLVDDFANDIF